MSEQSSTLFENHRDLLDRSAISPDVARERGYRSVTEKTRLESIHIAKAGRSTPGLLIPIWGTTEVVGYQYRPDEPRVGNTGKLLKYETPVKQPNRLDIHPRVRDAIGDPAVPLIVTEGARKVDGLISAGAACVIGLTGVWNWRGTNDAGGKVAVPDWQDVALNGRQVLIAYDHDVMRNSMVQKAAQALADYLRNKGATVGFLWVPMVNNDEHTGVDDWLASGGTLAELLATRTDTLGAVTAEQEEIPAPVAPPAPFAPVPPARCPNRLREWFARFICPMSELDLDLLVLWALHTHGIEDFYTTPRLLLSSPVPGAGKTTVLEHLQRLAFHPVNLSAVSSPALLTRMLDEGMRTILIDECDRSLRSDKPGVEDLLAIINTGYKRGGTRPVLVPSPGGKWVVEEHSTFAPVVMSGRSPVLPDDTMSRAIIVTLLPDMHDRIEDSDWELIEPDAAALVAEIEAWKATVLPRIRAGSTPIQLPAGLKGRGREKWKPLMKVAVECGEQWPDICTRLIERELAEQENERESQIMTEVPSVALLRDICDEWPVGITFWPTADILVTLRGTEPDRWGPSDRYPKGLTSQRLGRFLAKNMRLHSTRLDRTGPRGYLLSDIEPVANSLGLPAPVPGDPPAVTGASGGTGATGALTCRVCGDRMTEDFFGDGMHPGCATAPTLTGARA
jgi:hypothetical protein